MKHKYNVTTNITVLVNPCLLHFWPVLEDPGLVMATQALHAGQREVPVPVKRPAASASGCTVTMAAAHGRVQQSAVRRPERLV